MRKDITITESEYRELVNTSKLNSKEIDRKAYKIAERLNEIKISIEVEGSNYNKDLHLSIEGHVDNYCLLTKDYIETPKEVRDAIIKVKKILERIMISRANLQYGRIADLLKFQHRQGNIIFWLILIILAQLVIIFTK